MARAEVNIDAGALREIGMRKAHTLVSDVTRRVFNRANVLTPVDTGRLRASGTMSVQQSADSVVGGVEFTADYAMAVHEGTRAHTITPRNARVLRFVVGGQVVFARSVQHPGTRPRPFLRRALENEAGGEGFTVVSR